MLKKMFAFVLVLCSLGAVWFPAVSFGQTKSSEAPNTLTQKEKQDGWVLLFDGKTTTGWRGIYKEAFPKGGWIVENGVLTVLEEAKSKERGGDIITVQQYGNFELSLDFKLTPGANSGIKYFILEDPKKKSGAGVGPEYQLLDDQIHPDAKLGINGNRTCGSLYDLIPANTNKPIRPIGEWNTAGIVAKGKHVEHWLNGVKILEYERGSQAFKAFVEKSKFNTIPNFGGSPQGHILLQEHGNRISFRNIKIRILK